MIVRTATPGRVEYRDPITGLASVASYPEVGTDPQTLALIGSGELSAILSGSLTVEADPLGIWDDPDGSAPRVPDINLMDRESRRALADEARAIIALEGEL